MSKGNSIDDLINEVERLRTNCIFLVRQIDIIEDQFGKVLDEDAEQRVRSILVYLIETANRRYQE